MVLGYTKKQKGGKFCYYAQIVIEHHQREKESIRSVCMRIAPKIGIHHKHLYHIAFGYNSPGPKTAAKIEELYRRIKASKNPRKSPPLRIVTTFPDLDLGKDIAELTMDERRTALIKALKEKRLNQDLPPFMGRRERYSPPHKV